LKHLKKIYLNSELSHDVDKGNKKRLFDVIENALIDLNPNTMVEIILMIIACAENLKIRYDFSRDSVEGMDPFTNKKCKGICYIDNGDIYIHRRQRFAVQR
jgi:hypothetical protein